MTDKDKKIKEDKILNNNYIKGNIESEKLPDPKPESDYESEYLDDYYDTETYEHKKRLSEEVYSLFQKSQWAEQDINKGFPKDTLAPIYAYFRKNLKDKGYSYLDIFLETSDFLGRDTDKLYELIPLKFKSEIQIDLETKYDKKKEEDEEKLF